MACILLLLFWQGALPSSLSTTPMPSRSASSIMKSPMSSRSPGLEATIEETKTALKQMTENFTTYKREKNENERYIYFDVNLIKTSLDALGCFELTSWYSYHPSFFASEPCYLLHILAYTYKYIAMIYTVYIHLHFFLLSLVYHGTLRSKIKISKSLWHSNCGLSFQDNIT